MLLVLNTMLCSQHGPDKLCLPQVVTVFAEFWNILSWIARGSSRMSPGLVGCTAWRGIGQAGQLRSCVLYARFKQIALRLLLKPSAAPLAAETAAQGAHVATCGVLPAAVLSACSSTIKSMCSTAVEQQGQRLGVSNITGDAAAAAA